MAVVGLVKMGAVDLPQNVTRYLSAPGQGPKTQSGNASWNPGHCVTVYEIRARLTSAVPAGNSIVITVMVNDVATPVTLTLTEGQSSGSNLSDIVTLGNHDELSVQVVMSSSFGNTNDIGVTIRCRDFFTGEDCSFGLPHNSAGTSPPAAAYYMADVVSSDTSRSKMEVPFAECVLRGTSRSSLDVYRNGASLYTGGDDLDDLYFAPGDLYALKYTNTDGAMIDGCVRFRNPMYYAPLLFGAKDQAQATTRYMGGWGSNAGASATESDVEIPMPACTVRDLYCAANSAPPSGQTITYTLRKNGVDTALTCTVTSAGRQSSDAVNTVDFDDMDLLSIKIVTSATTGTLSSNCSIAVVATV